LETEKKTQRELADCPKEENSPPQNTKQNTKRDTKRDSLDAKSKPRPVGG